MKCLISCLGCFKVPLLIEHLLISCQVKVIWGHEIKKVEMHVLNLGDVMHVFRSVLCKKKRAKKTLQHVLNDPNRIKIENRRMPQLNGTRVRWPFYLRSGKTQPFFLNRLEVLCIHSSGMLISPYCSVFKRFFFLRNIWKQNLLFVWLSK